MRSISRYIEGPKPDTTILFSTRGDSITVNVPLSTFERCVSKYKAGALIQEAFPMLSATEREFMITGFTPEEQEAIFGEV
jgi:hypothetical protein